MHHIDTALEMSIGWNVLVVCTRSAIVRETQSFPFSEMHVQQSLIRSVETDSSICEGKEAVIVAQIRFQREEPAVEAIGPTHVRDGSKCGGLSEELVRRSEGYDICIDVDNVTELGLTPKGDLCESRVKIGTAHEVEVGRRSVDDAVDGNDLIVDGLW